MQTSLPHHIPPKRQFTFSLPRFTTYLLTIGTAVVLLLEAASFYTFIVFCNDIDARIPPPMHATNGHMARFDGKHCACWWDGYQQGSTTANHQHAIQSREAATEQELNAAHEAAKLKTLKDRNTKRILEITHPPKPPSILYEMFFGPTEEDWNRLNTH